MAFCSSIGLSTRVWQTPPLKCGRGTNGRTVRACQHDPSLQRVARRDLLRVSGLGALAAALVGATPAEALNKKRMLAKAGPPVELPGGITYRDINMGKGNSPREGDTVAIHYSLFYDDFEVESSRESQGLAASPVGFTYGARTGPGSILKGLNDGMYGMRVGGLRWIVCPSNLAYGAVGKPPFIPPNADVEFAVSLLSCKRSGSNPNIIINPDAQVF